MRGSVSSSMPYAVKFQKNNPTGLYIPINDVSIPNQDIYDTIIGQLSDELILDQYHVFDTSDEIAQEKNYFELRDDANIDAVVGNLLLKFFDMKSQFNQNNKRGDANFRADFATRNGSWQPSKGAVLNVYSKGDALTQLSRERITKEIKKILE